MALIRPVLENKWLLLQLSHFVGKRQWHLNYIPKESHISAYYSNINGHKISHFVEIRTVTHTYIHTHTHTHTNTKTNT